MAPKNTPWSKIASNAHLPSHQNGSSSPARPLGPGKENMPSTPAPLVAPAGAYSEAQEEELEALKAIYMEDFEEVEAKGAWHKTTDRALRLRVKALSDEETFVVLYIRLTATYPKSVPTLTLESTSRLRQNTLEKLKKLLTSRPKELVGDVMIHDIAAATQEILEDDVTARANEGIVPTLEEERAVHEAANAEMAKRQEEEMKKKREEEKAEEERALQQMVNDEMRRKELMIRRKSRGAGQTPTSTYFSGGSSESRVTFERMIMFQDSSHDIEFSAVEGLLPFQTGPITESFLVKPVGASNSVTMVLKRMQVTESKPSDRTPLKKAVLEFEEEIEDLKRLRQANILGVYDFKIERTPDSGWEIDILMEFANKGSLAEKLEDDGHVAVEKVRAWSVELLEAADFYHRNGVIHKRIHPRNVLLFKPPNGNVSVKLADAGFQESLHALKDLCRGSQAYTTPRTTFWVPAEILQETRRTRKTDVWDLGVVFVQMIFGLDAPQKYSSPQNLMDTLPCSEPLEQIMIKFFKPDPKKRPSAFEMIPSEFLRDNVPVYSEPPSPARSRLSSTSYPGKIRRESSAGFGLVMSRYASEWVEVGRLGKGGYGEVVKARNKVDGRIYAIKKIKQNSASALSSVLGEVMLLSRLNHPYVVRYYTAWKEEELVSSGAEDYSTPAFSGDDDPDGSESDSDSDMGIFARGTTGGGLDFISSSKVEFEGESEDDDDEGDDGFVFGEDSDDDDDDIGPAAQMPPLKKKRTTSGTHTNRPVKTMLYIQMEFCEKQTLRDIIRRDLYDDPDEYWRLFRQILEGLAHIHGHGIIHRDLKPDNIFIDVAKIPKIGDFGLATSGQYQRSDKAAGNSQEGDMTRSVGTALYVAPELRSTGSGNYTDKVDMYSMGIIFFEMCYPLKTAMERDHVIRKIREKRFHFPADFETSEKSLQRSIITSLISHRPSERPSCGELLRGGKVPVQMEDEAVKEALKALSDRNSPHYSKMMAALFSQKPDTQAKDYAWDMGVAAHSAKPSDVLLQNLIKDRLAMIFSGHGAVETQRQVLLPWSAHYANQNVVKLFDPSGTLVQLPYDLTLPFARSIGRGNTSLEKTYTIGSVYRDSYTSGAPRSNGEADFDIVSYDTLDLALKEAEVLKVIDEVIDEFPSLATVPMCFHLNHSDLLEMIMDFARIHIPQRPAVKEILSKLNIQENNWTKVRNELRAPEIGVSSTSLDDLARFDWRDTPEKAFSKIRRIFEASKFLDRTHAVFAHLSSVVSYMKHWGIKRKVYINPLSSFNEKFYAGGVLFQCLFDSKKREVFAAGGRYDRLIEEYRPKVPGQPTVGYHAVGMNLGWDRLVNSMARYLRKPAKSTFLKKQQQTEEAPVNSWMPRRCDCLVASFDPAVLRSTGVKMVADLISHGYTAELAVDAHSFDDLLRRYRDDRHSWVIVIKHTGGSDKPDLKIKNMEKKEDTDIRSPDLYSYLRNELRDREAHEGSVAARQGLRTGPVTAPSSVQPISKANVDVLMAQHRSKKSNKWSIIEAAQTRSAELLSSFQTAPIAAVETKDEVMNLIRETRLSDPDSWRKCIQSLPVADRKYLQELHDLLLGYAARWKEASAAGAHAGRTGEGGKAFVYNFRTGGCLLYDLEG